MNVKLLQKRETGPFEAGSYHACLVHSYEYGRTGHFASPAKVNPGKLFVHMTWPGNRSRGCDRLRPEHGSGFDAPASHVPQPRWRPLQEICGFLRSPSISNRDRITLCFQSELFQKLPRLLNPDQPQADIFGELIAT